MDKSTPEMIAADTEATMALRRKMRDLFIANEIPMNVLSLIAVLTMALDGLQDVGFPEEAILRMVQAGLEERAN